MGRKNNPKTCPALFFLAIKSGTSVVADNLETGRATIAAARVVAYKEHPDIRFACNLQEASNSLSISVRLPDL